MNRWEAFTDEELREILYSLETTEVEGLGRDYKVQKRLTEEVKAERDRRGFDNFWQKKESQ